MRAGNAATIAGCALLVIVGCKAPREPQVSKTTTTGAQMIMNDDAAMMLTNARCEREVACERANARLEDGAPQICRRSVFPEMLAVVKPEACTSGVDQQNLSRCIAELRRETCEDERHALETLPGCTHFELCLAQ